MKKIIVLVLLVCNFMHSQERLEFTYKVTSSESMYQPKYSDIKEYILRMESELNDLTYTLIIKDSESLWFLNDLNSYNQAHMGKELGGSQTIYYDSVKNEIVEQHCFVGNYFIINKKPIPYNWELVDESKTILGYICKKAVFKETKIIDGESIVFETIAWYCPEIKYAVGPLAFFGLDGLILELTDKRRKYYCTEIVSKSDMKWTVLQKPKQGKEVSEEEYLEEMIKIQNEIYPGFRD